MVASKTTDRRVVEATKLQKRAKTLRDRAEADRIKNFPKVGESIRVRDNQTRLVFGLHNKSIAGAVGVVKTSWPHLGEIIVEFRNIPVLCGECGQRKAFETGRLEFPKECEKVSN